MILESVIAALAAKLAELPFVTRTGGVVQSVAHSGPNGTRTLPGAAVVGGDGSLQWMVPDSREAVMLFFDMQPSAVRKEAGQSAHMEANGRMVYWINQNRLSPPDAPAVATALAQTLRNAKIELEGLHGVIVRFQGEDISGPAIFANWDLNDAEHQLCLTPYHAGAMRFTVNYIISGTCLPNIAVVASEC